MGQARFRLALQDSGRDHLQVAVVVLGPADVPVIVRGSDSRSRLGDAAAPAHAFVVGSSLRPGPRAHRGALGITRTAIAASRSNDALKLKGFVDVTIQPRADLVTLGGERSGVRW